ncbi:MAG: hypothetical protein H0U03_12195 [Actinobacteria bacterium]|nr:hypothetical protein [Actinomycetota bacterium]
MILAFPGPAVAGPGADAATARRGLAAAVAAGRVQALDAERYLGYLSSSVSTLRQLPPARAANLGAVLSDVARQAGRYNEARALTLFSMLDLNTRYLGRSDMPEQGTDVADVDGVVYRAFAGRGLQFHPLANFGKVNAAVLSGRGAEGLRHIYALLARGVPSGQATVWEYYFRYAGGAPPWRSGMAQAVAAQALARAGLVKEARRAYLAIPSGLLSRVSAGPWIRLYSFSPVVVLNAQLQAAISVGDYAALAKDRGAASLAPQLQASAAALFPRFDTGFWSLYALGGSEAPLGYHRYVVSLLEKLAQRTGDTGWAERAARFQLYTRQPPNVTPGSPSPVLFSRPADGYRDEATISFRLSKGATVTLQVAGSRQTRTLARGPHTMGWNAAGRPAGVYVPRLRAVDAAGNAFETALPEVTVRWDTVAPQISASVRGRVLTWRAVDEGTPWVRLVVRLDRSGRTRLVDLGRQALAGSTRLRLPPGTWSATLVAYDSARNQARTDLGALGRSS